MKGSILAYEQNTDSGVISGNNGQRYTFEKKDFGVQEEPKKGMIVDFQEQDGKATGLYSIVDEAAKNTNTILGITALAVTFFFGFIGTFVSRVFISKGTVGGAVVPTIIHFFITVLLVVPIIGWIIYLIGTLYYMVKNYKLVTVESERG